MSSDAERKEHKKDQSKMFKRMVFPLIALLVLGTSAVMVQEESAEFMSDSLYRASPASAPTRMMNRGANAMSVQHASTRSIASSSVQPDAKISASSAGMGHDVLKAMDESMKDLPDYDNLDRMLVHNGELSLQAWKGEVKSMAEKAKDLITRGNRGYVESERSYTYDLLGEEKQLNLDMDFRIQSKYFHETVVAIQELVGHDMVNRVTVNSRDVTDSYIDAASRADTLEASQKALRTLLEKATNVKEIMDVQRELNRLTEQYESQMKRAVHLKKQADYSSLSVHWEEKIPRKIIGKAGWRPSRAFLLAWGHVQSFGAFIADTLIYSSVWVVPILVVCLLASCIKK